jgi:hypothetical protein
MGGTYLDKLNADQRRAVEFGIEPEGGVPAGPLLVIAGAGSGKTNTLAHRVAHLIVKGADPRRILLMTFSRRAAAEMSRWVARICTHVLGKNAGAMTDALTWAGIDDRPASLPKGIAAVDGLADAPGRPRDFRLFRLARGLLPMGKARFPLRAVSRLSVGFRDHPREGGSAMSRSAGQGRRRGMGSIHWALQRPLFGSCG